MTQNINPKKSSVSEPLFEQVGGSVTFKELVHIFYEGVKKDELLAPMYPQDDWEGAKWRLQAFLEQYFGGPTTYSEKRGHPRLRMRHQAYHINHKARQRWLFHMFNALDQLALPPMADTQFREYFDRAALSLINTFEE